MQRFLVIQLRQLGDILLTTPLAQALKLRFPNCEVDFLAHEMGRSFLEGNPYLSKIFFIPNKPRLADQWELLKLRKIMKSRNYEVVFDGMSNPRSTFLSYLSGAKIRVGISHRRRIFYHFILPEERRGKDYIVREKISLIDLVYGHDKKFSEQTYHFKPYLGWTKSHLQIVQPFLDGLRKDKPIFALSATHRREARQWPLERYCELALWLKDKFDAEVIWLWGPGEKDPIARCAQETKTHLAPGVKLQEFAALIAQTQCFIGNSNGPSHIAVAVDTPSVHICGPSALTSWCPMNDRHTGVAGQDGSISNVSLADVQNAILKVYKG